MSLGLLSGKMAKNKKNEKQCKEQNLRIASNI